MADHAKTCGCTGSRSHPVDDLSAEHRTILGVVDAIEREVCDLRNGVPMRSAFWTDALDFLVHYADRCHHGKEEALLFVEMERCGLSGQYGPTACMRAEHATGREHRAAMERAIAARSSPSLGDAAQAWCSLMRQHIAKEDDVLFPMARRLLDEAAQQRLREGFAGVERHDMGDGVHCRYEALGRRLAAGQPASLR